MIRASRLLKPDRANPTCSTSSIHPSLPHDPGDPGGSVLLLEPELHLGPRPDKVVPDIAGWTRDHLPEDVFDDDAPGHLELAPGWVCEVISERTERVDRGKKMQIYRRERVRWGWLVNPVQRTVDVYRHEGETWTLLDTHEGDASVAIPPFDAIDLPLASLWAR